MARILAAGGFFADLAARGGVSATNVPPDRPRIDVRCPLWTSVTIAWRSVEREMPSWLASSRSGGRRVPPESRPSLIALPRRSTVSSNVVGGETGSNTAETASLRSIAQRYLLRAISWRIRPRSRPPLMEVGGQRADHRLKPGAVVGRCAPQPAARPLDDVVAPAQRQRRR